jgi:hypothetical protein
MLSGVNCGNRGFLGVAMDVSSVLHGPKAMRPQLVRQG